MWIYTQYYHTYIILVCTVTRWTVGARPRAGSAFPQRLSVVRHACLDEQRPSAVLANVAVPAGGRPVPCPDERASISDTDATSSDGRCDSAVIGNRRAAVGRCWRRGQVRLGQTVQRRCELRDHRQHRAKRNKRVGRTHVSSAEYIVRSLIIELTGFLFFGPQLYESAHAQGNPPSDRAQTDRQSALHSVVRTETDRH